MGQCCLQTVPSEFMERLYAQFRPDTARNDSVPDGQIVAADSDDQSDSEEDVEDMGHPWLMLKLLWPSLKLMAASLLWSTAQALLLPSLETSSCKVGRVLEVLVRAKCM